MAEREFISISDMIPDAIIDLKYMTSYNFIGRKLYDKKYDKLRYGTLKKLKKASEMLKKNNYRIIIWDAYRPLHVQKIFWDAKPDERYVAPPERGSKHNRGCAVDMTLATLEGNECRMPTVFDDFSKYARADNKKLDEDVLERLRLLQNVMIDAGFEIESEEWWHFNDKDWSNYPIE